MPQTCDVAVIGAGIVGSACAYELSLAGLRVALVEPAAVGSGATNLGYGSLSIQDEVPGQFQLTRCGLFLWDKLVEFLPRECEYRRCGTIWIALNQSQLEAVSLRHEFLARQGVDVELLDGHQVSEAEPGLSHEVAGGLYVAADGCLRASRAAEFLIQLAAKNGTQQLAQRAVSIQNHEVKLEDGTILYAGNIVNAAGNDAGLLTPELPLEYSKGHVLVVEADTRCARQQVCEIESARLPDMDGRMRFEARQNAYLAANQPSEVWIGSSSQPGNSQAANSQVEPKVVASLLRRAIEMIPAIGRAKPLRSWTGLRSGAPDGLPLIGRVGGEDGIIAATGHGGSGATVALATARLIVAELMCQTPEIDPMPYLPARFEKSRYAKST